MRPAFRCTLTRLAGSCASSGLHTKKDAPSRPICVANRLPVSGIATERRRARVRKQRDDWFARRLPAVSARPEHVVFIDETSVKTNLTRQRGWSQRGERRVMDAPFGSWGTQTFIAGLSSDALVAPWVIKGAMDGEAFAAYVEQVLVPELEQGTVVILDNLATHKNIAAAKAMRE